MHVKFSTKSCKKNGYFLLSSLLVLKTTRTSKQAPAVTHFAEAKQKNKNREKEKNQVFSMNVSVYSLVNDWQS